MNHARSEVHHSPGRYPGKAPDPLQSLTPLGDPLPALTVVPGRVDAAEFWDSMPVLDHHGSIGGEREGLRPAATVALPLGLGVADGQLVNVPAERSPHFVVVGSTGAGRSSTLRALIESIRVRFSPDGADARPEAKVVVIDERGELADEYKRLANDGYLLTDARSPQAALATVAALVDARTPSPDAMPSERELRNRSWYQGPEVFVLIETPSLRDQDWVGAAAKIAEARSDLGVHIYLSDTAGRYPAKRLSNPLHRGLSDAPTLLLSGPASEGVIWPGTGIRFETRPPGRGLLVDPTMSTKPQTVQIPYLPSVLPGY